MPSAARAPTLRPGMVWIIVALVAIGLVVWAIHLLWVPIVIALAAFVAFTIGKPEAVGQRLRTIGKPGSETDDRTRGFVAIGIAVLLIPVTLAIASMDLDTKTAIADPTSTPRVTIRPSPSATASPTPTRTLTPTVSPVASPTPVPVPTAVPAPTAVPTPTPVPTLRPTPGPPPGAVLTADSVTYSSESYVGGSIFVNATIHNSGSSASEPVKMQFGGLKDYADIIGCTPACETSDFFGDWFAQFSQGIGGGQTATFKIEFLAKAVGVAHWSVTMYEGADKDFFYGTGTTTIR